MFDLSSKFNTFYNDHVVLPKTEQDKLHDKKQLNIKRLKFDVDRFRLYRNNSKRLRAKLELDLKVNYSIKAEDIEIIVNKLVERI